MYKQPLTATDRSILAKPIAELVADVRDEHVRPIDILRTYGKVALKAQARTNCLTEIMLPAAEAQAKHVDRQAPLAGIPVSLKDSLAVAGYDVSVGYSRNCNQPYVSDGAMVRLLKDAGAVPYVKTNLPISLLSFESTNDVWGRTSNPHNAKYSPGGESALLALGGRLGIGSDVAGSVRAPAHFSGIFSLRCSTGRWPKMGMNTSMPGQEGIPSVFSPMTRTLDDLTYFSRAIFSMEPWRYDHTVHPIPWRADSYETMKDKKMLRIGVLRTDGVVDPSPACARALDVTVKALQVQGHEVVEVRPPSPYRALVIASVLLNADGCHTFSSFFQTGEWCDPGAAQLRRYMRLPRPLKYLWYLWTKYVRGDELWAGLLRHWRPLSAAEQWTWVAKREAYKAEWHAWWTEQGLDGLLTPPNATPAVPHDGMHDAVSSCGYTFLFNLVGPCFSPQFPSFPLSSSPCSILTHAPARLPCRHHPRPPRRPHAGCRPRLLLHERPQRRRTWRIQAL